MADLKLSIIVPVYNERATIAAVLARIRSVELPGVEREIVLVDDGSTDGTRELLVREVAVDLRVILHPSNRGKGAAVRTGLAAAGGDYVLIQDADLEYDPADYAVLLTPVAAGAECVYGSRFLAGAAPRMTRITAAANRFLTGVTRLLYGLRLTDMETCYKLVRTDLLRAARLEADGFDIEPEITAKLAKRGVEIREVAVRYAARTKAEGKKIGWRDGAQALWTLLKYRFVD